MVIHHLLNEDVSSMNWVFQRLRTYGSKPLEAELIPNNRGMDKRSRRLTGQHGHLNRSIGMARGDVVTHLTILVWKLLKFDKGGRRLRLINWFVSVFLRHGNVRKQGQCLLHHSPADQREILNNRGARAVRRRLSVGAVRARHSTPKKGRLPWLAPAQRDLILPSHAFADRAAKNSTAKGGRSQPNPEAELSVSRARRAVDRSAPKVKDEEGTGSSTNASPTATSREPAGWSHSRVEAESWSHNCSTCRDARRCY